MNIKKEYRRMIAWAVWQERAELPVVESILSVIAFEIFKETYNQCARRYELAYGCLPCTLKTLRKQYNYG